MAGYLMGLCCALDFPFCEEPHAGLVAVGYHDAAFPEDAF